MELFLVILVHVVLFVESAMVACNCVLIYHTDGCIILYSACGPRALMSRNARYLPCGTHNHISLCKCLTVGSTHVNRRADWF